MALLAPHWEIIIAQFEPVFKNCRYSSATPNLVGGTGYSPEYIGTSPGTELGEGEREGGPEATDGRSGGAPWTAPPPGARRRAKPEP